MSVEVNDKAEDTSTQSVIQNRYTFWCHKRGGKQANANYEDAMKQVGDFQTVEHFWRIYNHLIRPSEFKTTTDYHLFKYGIKPTWEDPQNERGGKWMVRLKKGISNQYWEELILAIIGEQFDVGHEICGAVVSVRNNEDIISIWNKNAENTEAKNKIRDQMRRILKLPQFINVEYKKHQDSIVDKSSFRNTVVWRSDNPQNQTRKSRLDWNDRVDHNGSRHERNHKDSSSQEYSPRGYSSRYHNDKDKDGKDSSSHRSWHQSSGSGSSNWKSPRSHHHNKDTSVSPRNPAWSTGFTSGGNKPSPTIAPSARSGGSWTRVESNKVDHSGDKTNDSGYVPLGGGRHHGATPRSRTASGDGEQRQRGNSGDNVWGRVKNV